MQFLNHVGSTAKQLFTPISEKTCHCDKHNVDYIEQVYPRFTVACPECAREQAEQQRLDDQIQEAAQRKKMQQTLIQQRLAGSGIPRRFIDKMVQNYQAETPQQQYNVGRIREYAREFISGSHSGRNLALIGNSGTGKTHLACAVANHVMRNCGGTARFLSISDLNRLIRESKRFDATVSESEMIDTLASHDLLVIDEIGIQSGTDAESRAVFDVFNERYQRMVPTIFLSNLSLDDFQAALGMRIIDRIKEGGGEILIFNWGSYRA